MSIEGSRLSRMDFNSTRHALALDIYDSTPIFQFLAAIESYKLAPFLAIFSSPSTPTISAITAGDDGEKQSDCGNALT